MFRLWSYLLHRLDVITWITPGRQVALQVLYYPAYKAHEHYEYYNFITVMNGMSICKTPLASNPKSTLDPDLEHIWCRVTFPRLLLGKKACLIFRKILIYHWHGLSCIVHIHMCLQTEKMYKIVQLTYNRAASHLSMFVSS